jgi:hypothetical protein
MYVLSDHNLGFIAHPKTASTATQRVLRGLGAAQYDNHHGIKDHICQRILDTGGLIMSTIRNPFDLMVSWYFHYKQRTEPPSFKEWLPQQLANPNDYIRKGLFYGLPWTNRVLRFENLQDDFNAVLSEVALESVTIAPFNVSHKRDGKPYQEMYDFELIHLVQHHFGDVIAEHGYSF